MSHTLNGESNKWTKKKHEMHNAQRTKCLYAYAICAFDANILCQCLH